MSAKAKEIALQGRDETFRFFTGTENDRFRARAKFSRVYRGESSDGRKVIVKMLNPELAAFPEEVHRFKNETLFHGLHPGIIAPSEYIAMEDKHFLIIDCFPSIDLARYIKAIYLFRKTRIRLALSCVVQLLDALEAVHQQGVIHADIKPANVLMRSSSPFSPELNAPEFRLIDFGMVRVFGQAPDHGNSKASHQFVLGYSPPEQVLGFHDLTGIPSDLYNVGMLLYEMITKQAPYRSDLSVKLFNLQTSMPLERISYIPTTLMDIILKATHKYHFKKPPSHYKKEHVKACLFDGIEGRYHSAKEMQEDILNFIENWKQ